MTVVLINLSGLPQGNEVLYKLPNRIKPSGMCHHDLPTRFVRESNQISRSFVRHCERDFHQNVFLGFQEDGLGIKLRDIIGVDQILWGSDYPHTESTFPRSRQILEEILVDCSEEEKAKIAGGNAARVYHLA